MKIKVGQQVEGGRFYGRLTPDGPLVPTEQIVGQPDAWVCRRVADFPGQQVPTGGALAQCTECGAPIAFNPARNPTCVRTAPKVCMQCAFIRPLPMEPR